MIAMKEETSSDQELEEEGIASSFKATHVLQPESLVEGSGWRSWKEGPGERGDWEAQWQDYLRTLQPPGPGGEPSVTEETSVAPWEDTRAFLASFEQVAQACQWPRGEWVAQLVPALNGAAEEAFQGLDVTHQGDYGKVKAAILRAEALRMEKQRQHFRHFSCPEEVGDPRRLHGQVQELCHRWLRPERHSKEQILELLILEQFLASLPSELQGWIRAGGPGTCSQAVALAEDFLRSQQMLQKEKWQGPATDEFLGALDAAEELLEVDQSSDTVIGGGIKCPSQTSSLLPLEEQGTDQTRVDEGQRKLQEAGPSLQVVQQSPTEPSRETMVWPVLKEEEEEKNEDPLDIAMGSHIKMETSQGGGNQSGDPLRATPRISQKNGRKKLEKGSQSREKLGDQPLETEEAPPTGLTGGLSASVHQSSNVWTSDKRPLVSRYGRKYHYLHELDIADSTEDHVESQTSAEKLQQRSSCDKQDRKLTSERKLESSENSLEGKQRNHLEEKSHNSPEHGNRLSCPKSLKRNQGIQSEQILHGCPLSRKRFTKREQLISHEQECSAKKKQEYLKSGRTLTFQQPVTSNQELYLGKKPYKCSWCGKYFNWRAKLKIHQRTHTGERLYKCLECGKSFLQRGHLKLHQRTHTGEKPYKCLECGKTFSRNHCVKRHQSTHTGEKPYKCFECGKRFARSQHVKIHQRTHTGEKPYKCHECGKTFRHSSRLRCHQRIHVQEAPTLDLHVGDTWLGGNVSANMTEIVLTV